MKTDPDTLAAETALKVKAGNIYDRLMTAYGMPDWPTMPALDELVNTVLSQNTNDRNRDLAFASLRNRFPTWEAVRDAPLAEVIDCIRPAGLGNQKGARIQNILRGLTAETGGLDLSFLTTWEPQKVKEWLTSFKGVGLKTASIVMLFSLGIPAFPVDTHIYRVSGRLGLRPQKMNVDDAHAHLASLFPPEIYGPAHINLILLGRRTCDARKPDCANCILTDLCDFYRSQH
jgi:endonuclease-3